MAASTVTLELGQLLPYVPFDRRAGIVVAAWQQVYLTEFLLTNPNRFGLVERLCVATRRNVLLVV